MIVRIIVSVGQNYSFLCRSLALWARMFILFQLSFVFQLLI
jgi:hypothetical protein